MDATWAAVSAISGAVTVGLLVFGTIYASRSVREARRSRAASVILQFQSWHHSEAGRVARRRLFAEELSTVDGRFSAEVSEQLEDIVDHHEFLAMLVAEKLIDEKIAMTFYRYSPRLCGTLRSPLLSVPGSTRSLRRIS